MDNENTKIKDTGSWSPFYYWIVGVVTMCALMWMLPNNYPREPWENIIRVLLGALFIFLFFVWSSVDDYFSNTLLEDKRLYSCYRGGINCFGNFRECFIWSSVKHGFLISLFVF